MHSNAKPALISTSVLLAGLLFSIWTMAADATGFRVISVDGAEVGIWYPSDSPTNKQRLGPFVVEMARDAPIRSGRYEVVLFSHGNSGFYRNHYLTTQALADTGYIVVAPQHEADHLIGGTRTAKAMNHRYQELVNSLEAVLNYPEFSDSIDREKIHGMGYSLGGATILLASGAEFSSERIVRYCRKNEMADPAFCEDSGWFFNLVQFFRQIFQLSRHDISLKDTPDPFRNPPIITGRAVLVAPVFQGIDPTPTLSVSDLTVFAIEGDTIAIPEFHASPLHEAVSRHTPSNYKIVPGHHFAFIAPFPEWLTEQEDIPVAKDPEGFNRTAFLKRLNTQIVSIFEKH